MFGGNDVSEITTKRIIISLYLTASLIPSKIGFMATAVNNPPKPTRRRKNWRENHKPELINGETGKLIHHRWHSELELDMALNEARGFRSDAALALGMSIHSLNERIRNSVALQNRLRDIEDYWLDKTENKLFAAIDAGDTTAMIFHLKCKGKRRGWCERQEIVVGGSVTMEFEDSSVRKPPRLVLGFSDEVNKNAPDGTTIIEGLPPRPDSK